VIALAVVLAGAATTTACVHPRVPPPVPPASTTTPTRAVPTATMQANGLTVTFDVTPAKVGTNTVHVYATKPGGQEATIKDWRVTASSSASESAPISASTLALTPGHAVAQVNLPVAGVWWFTFTLRVSATDEERLYADVSVS
jgi:copper transport protein